MRRLLELINVESLEVLGGRRFQNERGWWLSPLLGGAASAATLRSQGLGARELCAAPRHCEPWGITPMKVRRAQSQRPSRNSVLTVCDCRFVPRTACTDLSHPIALKGQAGARSPAASAC